MESNTEKAKVGRKAIYADAKPMTVAERQSRSRNISLNLLSISELKVSEVSNSNLIAMLPKLFARKDHYTIRVVLGELSLRCDGIVTVTK